MNINKNFNIYKQINILNKSKNDKSAIKTKTKINSIKSTINLKTNIKYIIKIIFILFILFLFFIIKRGKRPKKFKNFLPKNPIIKSSQIFNLSKKSNEKIIKNELNETKFFACFVGMGKQENKYIRELIEYYSKLGVDKFILADNNDANSEKFSDVIQDYIDKDLVDIIYLTDSNSGQSELYNTTYKKYNTTCKWFLYFDFDEYLEVHFEKDKPLGLKEFLSNEIFDKCEAIEFNWLMHTDNNLVYYDKRPLIERFTEANYNWRGNAHVKSIVRGNLNKTIFKEKRSNHVPDKNVKICDSMGRIIRKYNPFSLSPPVFGYGYLKHFCYKTAEEFGNKLLRGRPRKILYNKQERIETFFRLNKFSYEKLKVFEKMLNRTFYVNKNIGENNFRRNVNIKITKFLNNFF